MKKLFLALLFSGSFSCFSQARYSGFIDKYPIELVAESTASSSEGVYMYKKFDIPILLLGKLENGTFTFTEKDGNGKETATMTFKNVADSGLNEGIWKDLKTGKEFKITLAKEFEFQDGNDISWKNEEILQTASTRDYYFKLVAEKRKEDFYPQIGAIRIYAKKTDALIQELEFSGQFRGINSIGIGDYNFDGIEDFSVFESSYAGPNTSSIYYLFDPKTKKYFESGFAGISLSFDPSTKTISEHNQCCAGRIVTEAKYKLKNNKMVLIEEHCFVYDDKKGELVERKMKDCH